MKFSFIYEAGTGEVRLICQTGTVPQDAQLEPIRNLGEHVLPHFRPGS